MWRLLHQLQTWPPVVKENRTHRSDQGYLSPIKTFSYSFHFKMFSFFSFDRKGFNLILFSPYFSIPYLAAAQPQEALNPPLSNFLLNSKSRPAPVLNQCRFCRILSGKEHLQLFRCGAILSRNNSDFSASAPDAPIDPMQCILISSTKTWQFQNQNQIVFSSEQLSRVQRDFVIFLMLSFPLSVLQSLKSDMNVHICMKSANS